MKRSKGKQIAEWAVSPLRCLHLFKNIVTKARITPGARWRWHVRGAAHSADSERQSGLPFEQHQPIRFGPGQGLQQDRVDYAEERGVCANSKRKRRHCDGSGSFGLEGHRRSLSRMLPEYLHHLPFVFLIRNAEPPLDRLWLRAARVLNMQLAQ